MATLRPSYLSYKTAAAAQADEYWHLQLQKNTNLRTRLEHDFAHSTDMCLQTRFDNIICAWRWRLCGITPAIQEPEWIGIKLLPRLVLGQIFVVQYDCQIFAWPLWLSSHDPCAWPGIWMILIIHTQDTCLPVNYKKAVGKKKVSTW